MSTNLQAGFGRIVCLPDDPIVHIAGNDAKTDMNTDGVRDDLAVTCIALRRSGETYLVFTCDTVTINDFYVAIEQAICDATGVSPENIILNATHTHSAPTLKHDLPGRDAYLAKFSVACVDAAVAAIADLSEATLSYGSAQTKRLVFIRHYWMQDGTSYGNGHGKLAPGFKSHMYDGDPECQILRFVRPAQDKKDIVMINLAAHATICSGKALKTMLSADFPYYVRTFVEENADVHCAYFIAAGGDSTPTCKMGGSPFSRDPRAFGARLGEYVIDAMENMTQAQGDDVRLYGETYTAKRMKEGTEDEVRLAHAREVLALRTKHNSYRHPEVVEKVAEYGFGTNFEASGLVARANAPETGSFPIHVMKIGNVGITFFPGELFSTYGKQIKENSPMAFTFVVSCSEDHQLYFPNDIGCEHKFYEYTITRYERGTGGAVADRYCQIFQALKEGKEPQPR